MSLTQLHLSYTLLETLHLVIVDNLSEELVIPDHGIRLIPRSSLVYVTMMSMNVLTPPILHT